MKAHVLLFLLMMILSASILSAQKVSVGVLGGVNFQNLNGENSLGTKLEYSLITGFHAGVNILIPISPEIFFQPGLSFSTKGAANNDDSPNLKYRVNYIEVPMNIVYRGLLGKGYIMVGLGPYVGYAVNGKVIFENDTKSNIKFSNEVNTGEPGNITFLRAFDAGAGLFAGYEFENGIFLQLNTQLGLLKINPDDGRIANYESTVKNTGFGLSIGFRF